MKSIAIMQPYLFPYIGYFQLIYAVDKFVSYNDVHYIKQGWINRNNILSSGKALLFSVPVNKASSHTLIKDTKIDMRTYDRWKNQFYRTIEVSYGKSPYYEEVIPVLRLTFEHGTTSISELAENSIKSCCNYIGINTVISDPAVYGNSELKGKDRLIDICVKEGVSVYVNPIGGKSLYSKADFAASNIEIFFVSSGKITYKQFDSAFIPWLSIIDVMMFNSPDEIKEMIKDYKLV